MYKKNAPNTHLPPPPPPPPRPRVSRTRIIRIAPYLQLHLFKSGMHSSNLMVGQNGCVFAHSRVLLVNKQAECTKFWPPWALLKASAGNIWPAVPLLSLPGLNSCYSMFPTMIRQGWQLLRALKCSCFLKRIFTVASYLVMCICDTVIAVDTPLFSLFDCTLFKT